MPVVQGMRKVRRIDMDGSERHLWMEELRVGKDYKAVMGGYKIEELIYKDGEKYYGVFGRRNRYCYFIYGDYESAEDYIERKRESKALDKLKRKTVREGGPDFTWRGWWHNRRSGREYASGCN
jgi:hypothetical protein